MELNANLAARSYGAARPLTAPDPMAGQQSGPRTTAGQFAENFAQVLASAETTSRDTMLGDADPHALVAALSEAQLAVETTVAVRDKVVEAYLEILRMPV
ncbi:flagellar hook-basal body complex protein FliE [Pararhodobacter sp.]|uniref:flagellar hook-basal body complex protein FliE n=1 Tax=Pararhodobacter sp. TaxID=2127056 RepID=UPI002FDDB972